MTPGCGERLQTLKRRLFIRPFFRLPFLLRRRFFYKKIADFFSASPPPHACKQAWQPVRRWSWKCEGIPAPFDPLGPLFVWRASGPRPACLPFLPIPGESLASGRTGLPSLLALVLGDRVSSSRLRVRSSEERASEAYDFS